MRFMIMVPGNEESEAGFLPENADRDKEMFAKMGKFNEEMVKAGVMLAGEGLQPTSKGARLRFSGGKTTVIDGPFTESKELIAGFWLIQVKSKDEAVAWMKRAPFGDGVVLEIRQIYEAGDFGPALTPELREQEERHRAQMTAKRQS
ncbi:MAG TPA: YciI family protein [Gemmatimonadales bacterium]